MTLPPPREGEDIAADYASLGLTLGRHPLALLRSLERKEFIRREPRSAVAGATQHAFVHALVQLSIDPVPTYYDTFARAWELALFGGRDTSTPTDETVATLRAGLREARNSRGTIRVYENADHALLIWQEHTAELELPVFPPDYPNIIARWIHDLE